MRCLILAHSAAQAWPEVRIDFVLHRNAAQAAANPYLCHFYDGRESIALNSIGRDTLISNVLRQSRPDVAIFDSIGRGAQMSEAHRLGIAVINISLRKQARERGSRLQHLRAISQHWAVQTFPGVSDFTPYQRWLATMFGVELVELSMLFNEPSADRIPKLRSRFSLMPEEPYLLFVPNGGGYQMNGRPVADLMALMEEAEICVTGAGGGCVGQVLAHWRPLVASPLGGTDQRLRLELGQKNGMLLAADPTSESLYVAVMALLNAPDRRQEMIARQRQMGFRNGATLAIQALSRLLATRPE